MILLKSVHDPAKSEGETRYLIDWKWPAHKHHQALSLAGWPRELLPEAKLWDWFHHEPASRRETFFRRYSRQLEGKEKIWAPLANAALSGELTLLYDSKKGRVTVAGFLKEFLESRIRTGGIPKSSRRKPAVAWGGGITPQVDKVISRKGRRPLKQEMSFKPKQKLKQMPAKSRRVVR